jgi:transcriptional regulator with XRE-family HTH domain
LTLERIDGESVVAEFIRNLRVGAGLTQQELASRLNRRQSWISKLEAGDRRVEVIVFLQICRACGASPADAIANLERALTER